MIWILLKILMYMVLGCYMMSCEIVY